MKLTLDQYCNCVISSIDPGNRINILSQRDIDYLVNQGVELYKHDSYSEIEYF